MENEVQNKQYKQYKKPIKNQIISSIIILSISILLTLIILFAKIYRFEIEKSDEIIYSKKFSLFTILKSIINEINIDTVSLVDAGILIGVLLLISLVIYFSVIIIKKSMILSKLDDYTLQFYNDVKKTAEIMPTDGAKTQSSNNFKFNLLNRKQFMKYAKSVKKVNKKLYSKLLVYYSFQIASADVAFFLMLVVLSCVKRIGWVHAIRNFDEIYYLTTYSYGYLCTNSTDTIASFIVVCGIELFLLVSLIICFTYDKSTRKIVTKILNEKKDISLNPSNHQENTLESKSVIENEKNNI